ncbi:MAG: cobyrinate a,c-diamide synthase [Rhizobiales bacterium]|nr:cobyrinate a,c-diamide synthase [Hyphomicrobiales bacterium]
MGFQTGTGCVIAAPHSGAGKTLVTLGLLRALTRAGVPVRGAKVGPDYIDPAFHKAASGHPSRNLDSWAMGEQAVRAAGAACAEGSVLIVEGVMGLFDGADDGYGSTADIAAALNLPVILVVDAKAQGASAGALLKGFMTYRADIRLAAVIFNNVGSARHQTILEHAAASVGLPVLGSLKRDTALILPSRHLGLVQAAEHGDLDALIERAAGRIAEVVNLDLLAALCSPVWPGSDREMPLAPLGQRIAVARDHAFSFCYPHFLDHWHQAGTEIAPFSPLANEAPIATADAVFLPGGYPELHAERLSANTVFLNGLRKVAETALVYGECGGFMVLGDALIDAEGTSHPMAGLLPVTTSMVQPVRHLGYRKLCHASALPWPKALRGHEFHYSRFSQTRGGTAVSPAPDVPLFHAATSSGDTSFPMGLAIGRVMGSYAHVIAPDWQVIYGSDAP